MCYGIYMVHKNIVPGSLCTGSTFLLLLLLEAGQPVPLNRNVGKCDSHNAFPDIFAFNMTYSSNPLTSDFLPRGSEDGV